MKNPSLFAYLLLLVILTSCHHRNENRITDYTILEKDLVPEGVAFDPATGKIYISSTYKRKVISISPEGEVADFIREGQDNIRSVIGMEVDKKRNCLWAISSEAKEVLPLKEPGDRQWWSSVYQYDLQNNKLMKQYPLNRDSVFLNDITVADDGTVYATETRNAAIYQIKPGDDTLSLFLRLPSYSFVNGICFADDPQQLFVTCEEGIVSIDLPAKRYSLLPVKDSNKALSIDGLSFTSGYFMGHQSSKVCRFYLSPGKDSIIKVDTLSTGNEFDSSTTGEKGEGHYYFIVNSQIRSGIDYEKQEIKPLDSLENIIIRKIKL